MAKGNRQENSALEGGSYGKATRGVAKTEDHLEGMARLWGCRVGAMHQGWLVFGGRGLPAEGSPQPPPPKATLYSEAPHH